MFTIESLASFYWNPPKEVFTVPIIDRPIVWYGILFVTGFILGYILVVPIFSKFLEKNNYPGTSEEINDAAHRLVDKLCWFVVIGTLVGARLGLVFFYDWNYFKNHPGDIIRVWDGGLASHGGVIGVGIAMLLYYYTTKVQLQGMSIYRLMDFISIPSAVVAVFIRLGNFMNQEILGTPTNTPWAVVFGNPADGSLPFPRHPIQLYEAGAYLFTFIFLFTLWRKKGLSAPEGSYIGWMMILIFSSRFFLEFLKDTQESLLNETAYFQMGQVLSIPFIIFGIFLLLRPRLLKRKEERKTS